MQGGVVVVLAPVGKLTAGSVPDRAGDRLLDHRKIGRALVDQRDVDTELAIALDEFAGAIDRVNQPITGPVLAFLPADLGTFLAEDRQVGSNPRQALDNDPVGQQIGIGHRAGIVLVADLEAAAIHLHDRLASVAGQGDDHFAQVDRDADHACMASHCRAMNSAASERPSEKSSRSISRSSSASFHGTTSSSSGSSPGRRCGYRSRASTTWVWWLM